MWPQLWHRMWMRVALACTGLAAMTMPGTRTSLVMCADYGIFARSKRGETWDVEYDGRTCLGSGDSSRERVRSGNGSGRGWRSR